MSNLILLFLSVSFLFLSSASSSPSSVNTTYKCSLQQTLDLLIFKKNLTSINFSIDDTRYSPCEDWLGTGYNPIMNNWNTSTDCCDWNGVTCDRSTAEVIGLDLSCGMLQGTIHPNTTLFQLPRLQRLNLAYNDFTGSQLLTHISMFSNSLTHLNVSYCWLMGQVPADILHLHKLVSLDLSNMFDLKLEPHVFINLLQNSTVMKELFLNGVGISVFPTNLNISSSIKLLNLKGTGLYGNIPHNIFNLQSLEKLDLSDNSFTGHIPSEITLLPKLASLDLSYNGNGIDNLMIQPHIFSTLLENSTFLRYLYLDEVNIGYVLPTYLNISSSLRALHLFYTGLQGKLPDNILSLKYLEELDLSLNYNISGPLPKVNATTNTPLRRLQLAGISLSVEIHPSIGHLNSLVYLILYECGLNGSLPKSIGNLRNLEYLDLSSNMLSGTLPLELFSLPTLQQLRLSENQLTGLIDVLDNGPIQQTFQRFTKLTYLDLSYNKFRGEWELDTLLSRLTNLETLIMSYSGVSVITNNANHYVNPNFRTLSLVSCSLKVFPMFVRAMTTLEYLDLSKNDIHGNIPDWIGEIGGTQFEILDLSNNSITGTIPNVYKRWDNLRGFILNGNQLEGKMPTSLNTCENLEIIDVGNNHLNGTFPDWLGDLPQLMVLVLRSNKFHGRIVTSSFVNSPFPSLQVLDLSHNRFVGKLPTKYFQNFNAMKNEVKSNGPEYLDMGNKHYSITVSMKGVDQYFPQLLVEYIIVDLSNNKFKGEIPNIIGHLNSLKVLDLSHNSLTGQIPQTLRNISDLESLDLSWNQLTGEIPQSLVDLTFLEFLNLSQNQLMGKIPEGKQFNTFDRNSFGGNQKLCGLPLPNKCSERMQEPHVEGNGDEENGFTWKVVMMGYGCGTFLGLVLGYLILLSGRSKWFNAIAAAAEHIALKRKNT